MRLRWHSFASLILDSTLIFIAYGCALLLRFYPHLDNNSWHGFVNSLPLVITLQLIFNYLFGIYRRMWRFASLIDAIALIQSVGLTAILLLTLSLLKVFGRHLLPISVIIMGALLSLLLLLTARFFHRLKAILIKKLNHSKGNRILIVGAGSAGQLLAKELLSHPEWGFSPVGFIDDDRKKHGMSIHGIQVLGPREEIQYWTEHLNVNVIAIAMPSASSEVIRETVTLCEPTSAAIRIFPGITGPIKSGNFTEILREVRFEDLLNRESVEINLEQCKGYIEDQTVVVTGAAGSVGSELCRQVLALSPSYLIMVDINESDLHDLNVSLLTKARKTGTKLVPYLCSILDPEKLRLLMDKFSPQIVFHAAAYKHVPTLEEFPEEAFWTNIVGTLNILTASTDYIDRFIFVSTDKAAYPTNVLGFSKRIGELLTSSIGRELERAYCSVRFGNVLGSRGSVIPTFLRQIDEGGPITVTHPEMRRFFMTIPEAALLILQAGAFGEPGAIYILDMGYEIKIYDLARKLIRLRGYRPNKDIQIEIIGTRNGEKLAEVLYGPEEKVTNSPHPKIRKIMANDIYGPNQLIQWIEETKRLAKPTNRKELVESMKQILKSYGVAIDERQK
ncbi:MAG: polysaccharide biosynthesis protein [Armatimonadetes bacterium]|nr:polysaccharide biosynthesis protein [Armatimonadota bacterium]